MHADERGPVAGADAVAGKRPAEADEESGERDKQPAARTTRAQALEQRQQRPTEQSRERSDDRDKPGFKACGVLVPKPGWCRSTPKPMSATSQTATVPRAAPATASRRSLRL